MQNAKRRLLGAVVLTLTLGVGAPAFADGLPALMAMKAQGIPSLADLAAKVSGAVVNISAEEDLPNHGPQAMAPHIAPGTPFDKMFRDFFKNHGKGMPPMEPQNNMATSLGSGFVIDPSGIVITDNHVIADANHITVIFTDGRKLKAKLLGRDKKLDIAVLKVTSPKPLDAVAFGDSDKMRIGDPVMAVGNPFGLGGTVTAGIVSARHRNIDSGPYDDFIQTDASINKGNSGGPLFNMAGEVIGINTAILSPSGGSIGLGFATPANSVISAIAQLRKTGVVKRGWLGVRIQNVDAAIAESLGIGAPRGALIASLEASGPAGPAGLKPGDVIVKFNGHDVKSSRDLPKMVANTAVGDDVPVEVIRDGKVVDKTVKLGLLPDDVKLAAATAAPIAKPVAPIMALGMGLSVLDDAARKKFNIAATVNGVLVASVDPQSPAAAKGIGANNVILKVEQKKVATPADVLAALAEAKKAGKKIALLLVARPSGEDQFVALPVP